MNTIKLIIVELPNGFDGEPRVKEITFFDKKKAVKHAEWLMTGTIHRHIQLLNNGTVLKEWLS